MTELTAVPACICNECRAFAHRQAYLRHQQELARLERRRAQWRRYKRETRSVFYPCPGPRCMTNVRSGGLCTYCRRSLELAK